jgi:predicted peptidase
MNLEPEPSKPLALVMKLVDKLIHTFNIDTNRIYITGLSMGGYGTYDAISRYPGRFAAAVPVCGGGDVSKAPLFAGIPIWIFHGVQDEAVPVEYSLDMALALRKAGAYPGCTIYPGVGHFAWIEAYSDARMMAWLFEQRKK